MTTQISGTSGVTFPAGGVGNPAGAVVGTTDSQTLTNKTLGSGLVAGASYLTSGTAQASTSGTSITFSSIPSWVKRITVMFNGVSTSGSSPILLQIGSGSITSTGYISAGNYGLSSLGGGVTATNGFLCTAVFTAANTCSGTTFVNLVSGNSYISTSNVIENVGRFNVATGSVTLTGALDRVVVTTVNGTDTFDAGSINILYE